MRRVIVVLCLLLAVPLTGWADHPREVAGSCSGTGPSDVACVTTFVALRVIDEVVVSQPWVAGVLRATISDGEREIETICNTAIALQGCRTTFPDQDLRAGATITITVDAVGVGGWRVDAMYADV